MSKNTTDNQVNTIKRLATAINQANSEFHRQRTLQLQGNQSLGLGVIEGYFTITIPTTTTINVQSVTVTAPTDTTIMVGNLMWSLFYQSSGALRNYDNAAFYKDRLACEAFLSYDGRANGSVLLSTQQEVLDTVVGDNVARIVAKIRSSSSWSLPGGASSSALIFYQIRATFM